MDFPPYVPEEVRKHYRQALKENRLSPEAAKRLEQYIFSPAMRDVYSCFSNVAKSDIDWILFYFLGECVEKITPNIEKHRETKKKLNQLKIDAQTIMKKIEKAEQKLLFLRKEKESINNEIDKCRKELEVDYSDWFESYETLHVSRVVCRENNPKTESIRYVVSILYEAGYDMNNSKLKRAIATMAMILFDIDDGITYDDVRKVMAMMDIPPFS